MVAMGLHHIDLRVPPGPAGSLGITGLDFAGNTNWPASSPSAIFVWNATLSGTTPFAAYPATYLWRAYPREQSGVNNYWTFLFHANWETGIFQGTEEYYGMHPYPDADTGGIAKWEISHDLVDTFDNPNPSTVVFNQWYQQAVVVSQSGATELHTYYWDWPDTTTNIVTANGPGKSPAADPAIIMGDAPWNQGFEVPNAILRAFQFYDTNLSTAQIVQELASPGSVRTPWYLNLNPTVADITDKSGNGNDPAWFGAGRPNDWSG